jgi:hypothetical protein
MTMKKIYSCNLCNEEKAPEEMMGLKFSNLVLFKLESTRSTDGQHICFGCLF